MIKDTNYFTVLGWMRNRLHLKGNDLIIYAMVYSFSQDGKSEYKGSNSYMSDFTGAGERTISRILADLEERKFIEKTADNASTGQFNGWRAVPLEQLECLGIIPLEGDSQNGNPPSPKWQPPDSQNGNPTVAKMATPINKVDKLLSDSNLNDTNSDIEKVSKKESIQSVSNKPSARIRASYDQLITIFELSEDERKVVFEFIRHCQLNGNTLTNDALKRTLKALVTYPEDQRCEALYKAIDRNQYTLKPLAEKHYDFFGCGSDSRRNYQSIMEGYLKEYLGEDADFVFCKIWEFIQHCAANGQNMTNDRLGRLCGKLKKLYRRNEAPKMRKALEKAIDGGYFDIKDGDGWTAESIDWNKAMGIPLPHVDISGESDGESEDEDKAV